MYHDKKRKRILMKDGTSVMSSFGYAKHIINGDNIENPLIASDFHSKTYDSLNRTNISRDIQDINVVPESHQHDECDLEHLIFLIENSPRYEQSQECMDRIYLELEYYERTLNVLFLLKCVDLLNKFRENNVVWGVGRGSSCASYVAYLLEINDVDPLKYNIPFHEMSKEIQ